MSTVTSSAASSSSSRNNNNNNNRTTMPSATANSTPLEPLNQLLSDVLTRLEVLETKAGIVSTTTTNPPQRGVLSSTPSIKGEFILIVIGSIELTELQTAISGDSSSTPAIKAYDEYLETSILPFVESCHAIPHLESIGDSIRDIFQSIRFLIVVAARSKKPANVPVTLAEYLKPTQELLQKLQTTQSKLPRDLDRHVKAIQEMNACISWVVSDLPSKIVKESIASAEFWTNRIRKDFKDDAAQLKFCDGIKTLLKNLVQYIQTHHEMGLSFTGTSMSVQEAALRLTDESNTVEVPKSPKKNPVMGNVVTSGNIAGLMGELTKRQTADGSSAATGLKHVTKNQQTWRKEYNNKTTLPAAPSLESTKAVTSSKAPKKKPRGLPIFEYQDRGFKWLVENQTAESNKLVTVEITDAKQQVYIYNCENVTVKIVGKFKSLAIDNCEKLNVVFDDLISSTEIVNCKKLQLQVLGVCPVFNIDKTINIVVYLSKASKSISSFCTSLSSEMNVSFPSDDDTGDLKELPIPEQFVHTITADGKVTSEVSDLYH